MNRNVVVEKHGNKHCVFDENGDMLLGFDTNEEAWRFADKLNNEAVNRQEAVAEWSFKRVSNPE